MTKVEISLSEQTASRLEEAAQKLGVTPEEFLRISLEEKLARLDRDFQSAAEYVLDKNKELYKRLA